MTASAITGKAPHVQYQVRQNEPAPGAGERRRGARPCPRRGPLQARPDLRAVGDLHFGGVAVRGHRARQDRARPGGGEFLAVSAGDSWTIEYGADKEVAIGVSNGGVGPAKLKSLEVFYDGVPVTSDLDLLRRCCGLKTETMKSQLPQGGIVRSVADETVLRPGEDNAVLQVRRPTGDALGGSRTFRRLASTNHLPRLLLLGAGRMLAQRPAQHAHPARARVPGPGASLRPDRVLRARARRESPLAGLIGEGAGVKPSRRWGRC